MQPRCNLLECEPLFATLIIAPLGSIQELPAESCSEIKASEGDSVVSGKYWFDSIKPGQAALVPCDMLTGGVLFEPI